MLEHQPHRAHVVARVAPVAPGGQVAEHELVLEPERDRGGGARDLARQEVDRPQRRLVVVEDPAAREHPVALAVARGDEVGVRLRDAVRRERARRGLLGLRRLARLAEDLAGGSLVEADPGIDAADRLEHRRRPHRGELGGDDRLVPRARHEGRRGEVVHLGRAGCPQRLHQRVVTKKVGGHELDPGDEVAEALGVRLGLAPYYTRHLVALVEQKPREQGPVLPADSGDQRTPRAHGRITRVRHVEESTR